MPLPAFHFALRKRLIFILVSEDEIKKLHAHFKKISTSIQNDGVIDLAEFQQALGLKNSAFAERLFAVFDKNKDAVINFREFVSGLSVFCAKGTLDEKLQVKNGEGEGGG